MQHFAESFERLEPGKVPRHVAAAVAELVQGGYDVEIIRPSDAFILNGPLLRVKLDVKLPSRPRHDIRGTEYALLGDWGPYPASPPSVRLDRIDFPRGLPHINQTRKSSPVWPCLSREPLSAWFEGRRLIDLVARIETWLGDAASGRLMRGDEDAFEPIFMPPEREYVVGGHIRIGPPGYCVASARAILTDTERTTGSAAFTGVLRARYLPLHARERPLPPVVALDRVLVDEEDWLSGADQFDFFGAARSGVHTTPVLPGLVVLLAETDVHVGPPPEELGGLEEWCKEMGFLGPLLEPIGDCFSAWGGVDLVPVTFLVPRPRPLLGNTTGVPNVDCVTVAVDREGSIIPTLNLRPLDRDALARYSGVETALSRMLMVGVGALGSKLATHLARTAAPEMDFVDPDVLVEHNLARHDLRRVHVGLSKAEALVDELTRMIPDFRGSALPMRLQDAYWTKSLSLGDYQLLIDATASTWMPFVLSYFEQLPRVFSVFTIPGGDLGIATIEGPGRNPRTDDLEAAVYSLARDRRDIREWLEARFADFVTVGGCRDVTAIIADDVVSLHAARFSVLLRTEALDEPAGAIWIHDRSGILTRFPVAPSDVTISGEWTVRLGGSARETVLRMMEQHRPKEVAGYLHGIRDPYRNQLIVAQASVEPLLVQSETGVEIDTSRYVNPFAGTLEYLGSWHTHPGGGTGVSTLDEQTASSLASLRLLGQPLVFLIAGPEKMEVHLRGDPNG